MNFIPMTTRWTTIKRRDIFIVGVSVLIASVFWIVPLLNDSRPLFSYNIFKTTGGWGYDILVNDTLQIHQDFMPVLEQKQAFPKQEQAKQAAILVIKKMKAGKNPAISRDELASICTANE